MDGHCFAVLHSLNEKQNGLNCFRGSRVFFKQQKILFWSWTPFLEHLWPIWTRTWTNWYYRCFFFPLDGIFPPFIKHAESTVPPWFSDCQFFFCWGGWGVGGGELSYLEDLVVDVWTWKTFFEKRHINNAYSMKNSCNSCFAFCRASFLLFRHISYRTCNDRQLQQWARHVMKIRHRSRDLQMLLLGKRSLWTSMLSWIILLRWLQPKQWFFFFVGQPIMPRYVCVPETPGFDVRPSGKGQGPCWGGLLYVHVPPKTLLWTHPAKKAGTGCIHFQMLISRKLTWQSNITIFNRSYIFKRVGFPLSCWFSRV